MLRTMTEPLGEMCSVTRGLLRRGLGLKTSRRVRTQILEHYAFTRRLHVSAIIRYNHNIYGKVYRGGGLPFIFNVLKYVCFDLFPIRE